MSRTVCWPEVTTPNGANPCESKKVLFARLIKICVVRVFGPAYAGKDEGGSIDWNFGGEDEKKEEGKRGSANPRNYGSVGDSPLGVRANDGIILDRGAPLLVHGGSPCDTKLHHKRGNDTWNDYGSTRVLSIRFRK